MFGFQCGLQATLLDTIKPHQAAGVGCVQCYIGGSQTYRRRAFTAEDLTATKTFMQTTGFRLYTHACLCMNLASGSPTVLACLNDELKPILATGASTIVHIGSANVNKQPIGKLDTIVDTIKALQLKERVKGEGQRWPLLLENAAGEGAKFGSTWDDLEYLFTHLKDDGVGLCFDTAHAFGAGIASFDNEENILDMFNVLDDTVGEGRLQLIHLNDSRIPFGGKNDRHECLGQGYIWQNDIQPLGFLLKECRRRGIDVVLETPDPSRDYVIGCSLLKA